jgi:hypothetical protein
MKTGRTWILVSLVLAFSVAFTIAVHSLPLGDAYSDLKWSVLYWGPWVGISMVYFMKLRIGTVPKPAGIVTDAFVSEAIASRYLVERKKSEVLVRLDKEVMAMVSAKSFTGGTGISCGMRLTPRGTGTVVLLGIMVPPIALLVTLYFLFKALRFGENQLADLLAKAAVRAEERKTDITCMLMESMSEARRISLEAYEVLKSNYQDLLLISFVIGLLASFALLIASLFVVGHSEVEAGASIVFGACLMVFVASTVLSLIWVRRRYKPKMDDLRAWNQRISDAIEAEGKPAGGEVTTDSLFELLAKASKELPGWLEIRRKSMLAREPFWQTVTFLSVVIGLLLTVSCAVELETQTPRVLASGAIGFLLLVIGSLIYVLSNKRRLTEMRTLKRDWQRRTEELSKHMEHLLGGNP